MKIEIICNIYNNDKIICLKYIIYVKHKLYYRLNYFIIFIFNFVDEGIVARGVNEFFTGNRCIKTFEDIYQ